jgi:hypothetical protein
MNLLTSIQVYKDASPTNNPTQSTANWTSNQQGIEVSEPETRNLKVASKQTEILFSGVVETDVDNTTTFDLTKKSGVSSTYILKHNDSTAPNFRADREIDVDDTSQFTVTKSGALLTFTHSGGTAPDFSNLVFGDEVRIGIDFDVFNRGKYKLLSFTANSFTVENFVGVGETVTLSASDQIIIYSADGVQIGQKVTIGAGFAGFSQGTYEITDVGVDFLEINVAKDLPEEFNVLSQPMVYSSSKSFMYLEYDKNCTLFVNGVNVGALKPLSIGVKKAPGVFLRTGDMFSAEIRNDSLDLMSVLVISAE